MANPAYRRYITTLCHIFCLLAKVTTFQNDGDEKALINFKQL